MRGETENHYSTVTFHSQSQSPSVQSVLILKLFHVPHNPCHFIWGLALLLVFREEAIRAVSCILAVDTTD